MIRRSRFLVMTSAMMATILGCSGPTEVTADLELSEPVEMTLVIGETADIGETGSTLTLLGIPSDSRCPTDVTCVWEGNAEAEFRIATDDELSDPLTLNTSVEPRTLEWRGLRLEVVGVQPETESTGSIPADDYRVTFRVESR